MKIEQLRARLGQLKKQTQKQDSLWKPSPGKTLVRIVPYRFDQDNPFIELLFHYNLGGKNYLSPQSFGNPDPIVEMSNKLKTTGDKEDYKMAKQLEPKLRTFAPIIVRGELDRNGQVKPGTGSNDVKFWGFGKTVYHDILTYIADPDWGDITDFQTGRDLVIEFKTAEETGKSFPETKITVKPAQTPITDDAEELKEMMEGQRDIKEIYKEVQYDDLKAALEAWLNGEEASPAQPATPTTPVPETKTTTDFAQDKSVTVATNPAAASAAFDDLFKKKS